MGYGLDRDGWFRNLPELWEVVDERAVREDPVAALAAIQTDSPGPGCGAAPGTSS